MSIKNLFRLKTFLLTFFILCGFTFGQSNDERKIQTVRQDVRTMTVPISIFTEEELKERKVSEFVEAGQLIVREDEDEQQILSIKSVSNTPLSLAVLIQDDLESQVNLQLKDIKTFIKNLPEGSRVMVAYVRGGSLQVRQKFTKDLQAAADSIRIIISSSAVAPRSPYDGLEDAVKKFDGLPAGRRAVLFVSDGLDVSSGFDDSTPGSSIQLERAISSAQKRGVAVYSFYSAATFTKDGNSRLILNGQGSLERLADYTGGRAFFQGTFTPISFEPFFRDLGLVLNRQFALTYLSTHMKKGYHKLEIISTNPEVKIEHPKGYYYRKNKY